MGTRLSGRRGRFLRVVIVIGLAALPGCAREIDGPPIDWDSPQMREIEIGWESLPRLGGKLHYQDDILTVEQFFRKSLAPNQLRQLAASSKISTVNPHNSEFDQDILAYMVKEFVQAGDRQALVEILSKQCPNWIDYPENVEYYLVRRGSKLEYPIRILAEAYGSSRDPKIRHALVAALRRSFASLGISGQDDAAFVDTAMRWYEEHKGRLAVNNDYCLNELRLEGVTVDSPYEKYPELYNPSKAGEPLFKW